MMNPSILLAIMLVFILFEFIFDKVLDYLNAKSWNAEIPNELKDLYDSDKYEKAAAYAKENGRLSLLSGVLNLILISAMLILDGFGFLDAFVRTISNHYIFQTLLFFGILSAISSLINLPFGIYKTFVIEETFGFNKTTIKLFIVDLIKSTVLGAAIGGILISVIAFVYHAMPTNFWWIAWLIVSGFSLFFAVFYTSLILPIFNKLSPLEEGSLRTKIEAYAQKVHFPLKNIFVIDGSKRSSKANAFFSGMGKTKAIVLYDTLIADNTEEELVAILAHEVGHYKLNHIKKSIAISFLQTAVLFLVFGYLSKSEALHLALGAQENSFYIALIGFSMLFSPISLLTGTLMNVFSRKNEFEADTFAKQTDDGLALISALKKMSTKHLSNINPNKWYVFFNYSHPPLLERIKNVLGEK